MDVFLRPLIDELKELWVHGLDTRDAASENSMFRMRAALLWTVNDFPARSSLSGWSGQGYRACPTCNEDTPSMRIIGKTAYFGHRRFLPTNHHWRSNLQFDGRTERKRPPRRFSTTDILEQLRRVKTGIPGKHPSYGGVKRKRGDDELNWRKKSIFYELPYWATIELKHNLDVMHIEKNVCDSLLGTLLADPHKSKDTDNARRDLAKLGIRHELHLFEDGNKLMKPAADYTFSDANRRKFYYVRNAAKPEGSIAEGYVVDEALTFCSRYFDDVETRFNRPDRNDDGIHPTRQLSVFESQCKPLGKQSYVELDNNDRDKADEHKQELHVRLGEGCLNINEVHRTEFAGWFFEKTNMVVSSYSACIVNGVRFVTHDRDVRLRTQNSGVSVPGTGQEMFYGQLQQILEFSYLNGFSVVLFRCKWFKFDSKHMVTENNIASIDINGEAYKDDQFILASQAKQVFYVADPSRGPNWRVVQHVKHRSIWDIKDDGLSDIDLLQHNSSSNFTLFVDLGNLQEINLLRRDQDVIPILQPVTNASRPVTDDSSFLNDADEVELYDEEEESVEEYADEETDAENEIDTEEDDDDRSYHASDSD
ncbi:hypothetical protein UlMin_035768 [Ulmus minor]